MFGITVLLSVALGSILSAAQSPNAVTVNPGDPVQLICRSSYDDIKWTGPNGEEIKGDDRHILDNVAGTLNITVVGEDDVGEFKCGNKDNSGSTERHEIRTSPYVPRMVKSVNHVVGETAVLECTAWGTAEKFGFRWYKSKYPNNTSVGDPSFLEEIHNGSDNAVTYNIDLKRKNHFKQQLVLHNLTYDDYAYYFCFAENVINRSSSFTNLRVKDKLAPLWPFIGICVEIVVLIIIIVVYEKRKSKRTDDDDASEKTNLQSNANDHKGEENVRFRK